MQRLISPLKVVNSKCDNFHLFIVRGQFLITSDQEDGNIWEILTMKN